MTKYPDTDPIRVSVVIPYFQDQAMLDLVLRGLELDQRAPGRFEVIVADDGSAVAPDLGDRPYPVRTVRQADFGNRAGAARNLGARAASGDLLVFLDGDTVPAPGFIGEIARVCDASHLTVGRRRHAELSTLTPDEVGAWLTGSGPSPTILDEPSWLADGYAATDDLREADLRSYRFVISAVLACPRSLFERLGGFAEQLVGYGGEDWELARRAWLSGADLRYAPRAVGWHDGPDLAGRADTMRAAKNAETLRIAHLITDPQLRGTGLIWQYPRVVVRLAASSVGSEASWVACAEQLIGACPDLGLWTNDRRLPVADPRVHHGLPSAQVTGRAELIVDLAAPIEVGPQDLQAWQHRAPAAGGGLVLAASPRDRARSIAPRLIVAPEAIPGDIHLERWFTNHRPQSE